MLPVAKAGGLDVSSNLLLVMLPVAKAGGLESLSRLCLWDVFWTTQYFFAKLGLVVHNLI